MWLSSTWISVWSLLITILRRIREDRPERCQVGRRCLVRQPRAHRAEPSYLIVEAMLGYNPIGAEGAREISEALGRNYALSTLDLG